MNKIVEGMLRVESFNQRVLDPNGNYPVCIPEVRFIPEAERRLNLTPSVCMRCQRAILSSNFNKACPAVPPEERWSFQSQ